MTMSVFSALGLSESGGEKAAKSRMSAARAELNPDWSAEAGYEEAARQALARAQAARMAMANAPEVAPYATEAAMRGLWAQGAAGNPLAAARQQQAALVAGTDVATRGASQLTQERMGRQQDLVKADLAMAQQQQMEQMINQQNEAALKAHALAEAERQFAAEQAKRQHRGQIVGGLLSGGGAAMQFAGGK
jgi:ABC-type oligopeptide transport system substrate-binding subunit